MISILKSLSIFNSEYFYSDSENEVFCEIASFFQHFQQCLHLFCESNLLNRMKTVLYDIVSTWFDDQSKFISLREFGIVLTNAFFSFVFDTMFSSDFRVFALESTSESTEKLSACRHCKQTFNFKKIFRQHKREQHAKKSVVNLHFSINAVKSTCESIEILTVNSSFSVSLVVQSNTLFLLASLDIFNSNRLHQDLEKRRFNQVVIFIQHLQHCQQLYCESKVLEWVKVIFYDFVDIWFGNQSSFISLHDFDIVLTKAFLFNESVMIQSILISQKQQKLKITFEVSKIVKRDECKKIFKAEQTVKSTSTLQDIDIFDSTLASDEFEFDLYKEATSFLQHFQQSRIQYRKSDLLNLLSKCFCDFAFEWFKTQFEFISLKRFSRILSKTFPEAFLRRISLRSSNLQSSTFDVISEFIENLSNHEIIFVQVICKICKQSFNFNKKLYDHIRNHEALKFVKNSHFSINALNLVCEIMKKSAIINSLISLEASAASATSQKQIIEFAVFFETVNSLKCSNFQFLALEIVSIWMKKKSFQCFIISSQSSIQNDVEIDVQKFSIISSFFRFHTFKSICKADEKSAIKDVTILFVSHKLRISDQKVDVQKHSIVNSFFLIDTIKTTCKVAKKSAIVSIAKFSKFIFEERAKFRIRTVYLFSELKASRLNFSLNTFVTISKTVKNSSIQKIAHIQAMCMQCEQNFDFNKKFFEHISEHKTLKSVKSLSFLINTAKSICETMKRSAIACSFFSQKSSNFSATSRKLVTDTRVFL